MFWSRSATFWAPPRSALQVLTSWPRSAFSASFQRLASPCLLSRQCHPRRVEVAHPQVQVALLPLLQSSNVLLHLKVSVSMVQHLTVPSKLQILECAIPVHELWPQETPVFSQSTPSCDDTHDETTCTPYIQVSMSTFHREQFARPKSVLSPQDFAENQ